MTGAGNDFIIIDNRQKILDADRLGISSEGLRS